MLELPKLDKVGLPYLSYSQITMYKRSPKEYYETYIMKKPFEGNVYTEFGSKVGSALEVNDYSNFTQQEEDILRKVTRLDLFEREVKLQCDGFYVLGYIDTASYDLMRYIDYKTGGEGKEDQYKKTSTYTQMHFYALAIMQETGKMPEDVSVEFIRRAGNPYRGQRLRVENENPIKIPIEICEASLYNVHQDILKTAKEISQFYILNKRE
jgi:hypothetical protein